MNDPFYNRYQRNKAARERRESSAMTPTAFQNWLAAMKATGLARSDAACAKLLGVSANSIVNMKRNGTDRRTALACRALIHRLDPWGSVQPLR